MPYQLGPTCEYYPHAPCLQRQSILTLYKTTTDWVWEHIHYLSLGLYTISKVLDHISIIKHAGIDIKMTIKQYF